MMTVVLMNIQCDDYIVDIVPVPPMVALNDNGYANSSCTGRVFGDECLHCGVMLTDDDNLDEIICDDCFDDMWGWV